MLLYGASRFVIEFYRGDPRGMVGPLSTSQFISVILVPLSVAMLVWLGRRAPAPGTAKRRKLAA
jgi:phosphatidylglycerol:prolipoprotein diacylglycerol transferase